MFNIGDKVICIEPKGKLVLNQEYEVARVDGEYLGVRGNGFVGVASFYTRRFKLDPQGFKVGDAVRFKDGNGLLYKIQKVSDKGLIKVQGHPSYWRADKFIVVKRGELPPPAPKVPPPQNLMDELTRKVEASSVGVCSYAIEDVDGKQKYHVKDICHARLSRAAYRKKVKAIALNVAGHVDNFREELQPLYEEYVDYIIHRSPWAKAFIDTDIDTVMNSGVYLDVTQPYSYCVSAAVALRIGSECYGGKSLSNFHKAKEAGLSEAQAFVLFNTFDKQLSYNSAGGSHDVWSPSTNAESVFKFFNETDINRLKEEPYNVVTGKEYSITRVVGNDVGSSVYTLLFSKNPLVKEVKQGGWGGSLMCVIGDTEEEKFANACLIVKEFIN